MAPKRKLAPLQRTISKHSSFVQCPACQVTVIRCLINSHLDSDCLTLGDTEVDHPSETSSKRKEAVASTLTRCKREDTLPVSVEPYGDGRLGQQAYTQDPLKEQSGSHLCKDAEATSVVGVQDDISRGGPKSNTLGRCSSSSEASTADSMTSTNKPWNFIRVPSALKAPQGHFLMEDFISAEEEHYLVRFLDFDLRNPWKLNTFNGLHKGKAYGVITDLKRRLVRPPSFEMPKLLQPIIERMRTTVPLLKEFFPNETNSIDYCKGDGHWLKPHVDDRQLSGSVIVNLSLCGACKMTYERERGPQESYKILLQQRSLQVVAC